MWPKWRRGSSSCATDTSGSTISCAPPRYTVRHGNDYAAAVTYFSDTLYVSTLGAPVLPDPVRHHGQQRRTPTHGRPTIGTVMVPFARPRSGFPVSVSCSRPNPHHHSQVTMTLQSSTAPSPRGRGP